MQFPPESPIHVLYDSGMDNFSTKRDDKIPRLHSLAIATELPVTLHSTETKAKYIGVKPELAKIV